MFPSVIFRRTYDALQIVQPGQKGDLEYLRILHFAASTMESSVERALSLLLEQNACVTIDAVKQLTSNAPLPTAPAIPAFKVDLSEYDTLLSNAVK
jgi:hypothetical protein